MGAPTAGQKAIAAAEAWKQAEDDGRVRTGRGGDRKSNAQKGHLIADPRSYFGALFDVGKNYVDMARAVCRWAPFYPKRAT